MTRHFSIILGQVEETDFTMEQDRNAYFSFLRRESTFDVASGVKHWPDGTWFQQRRGRKLIEEGEQLV